MTRFMTRVELHGATYTDYENLHAYMSSEGFTNSIIASDGKSYRLPPAEYRLEASITIEAARTRASNAAAKTGRNFAVLVNEYSSAAWVGLQTVTAKAA